MGVRGVVHGVRVARARHAGAHVRALAVVGGARGGGGLVEGRGGRLVGMAVHRVAGVQDIRLAVDGVVGEVVAKAGRRLGRRLFSDVGYSC